MGDGSKLKGVEAVSTGQLRQRLAAILAADAAGYSRLMAIDERATLAALDAARDAFRRQIESHQGRVIDTAGDSVLALFDTAAGAASAALAVQQQLEAGCEQVAEDRRLRFRIGLHLGDVIEKPDGTVYGDGVNIASRLQALAGPGGIVISAAVHGAVRDRVAAQFADRGEQQFKHIAHPVRVYSLAAEGAAAVSQRAVQPPKIEADRPSIAVLAFENMSGDPEQEYFCDGISEDIITDLAKINGLAVIGRQSAFAYKGRAVDLRQVGRELGVRYVLEGSVRRAGQRVRVTAQLIEAGTGTHVWAHRYDHQVEDVFLVGDAVVHDIVEALDIKLGRGEDARIWRRAIRTVAAREAFLRGWSAYYESTPDAMRRAREIFLEVTRLEPDAAIGHAYVGLTYAIEVMQGWSTDPAQSLVEGRRWAEQSIALDPYNAAAHGARCLVSLFERKFDDALAEAQRALEDRPMCAGPRAGLAFAQLYTGDYASALRNARSAIEFNPLYPGWYLYLMAAAEHFGGRSEAALATLDQVLAASPRQIFARGIRIAALIARGRREDAAAEAEIVLRDRPDFTVERFASTQPFRDTGQTERYVAALRAAGLP
jgi:adenylate cyclase